MEGAREEKRGNMHKTFLACSPATSAAPGWQRSLVNNFPWRSFRRVKLVSFFRNFLKFGDLSPAGKEREALNHFQERVAEKSQCKRTKESRKVADRKGYESTSLHSAYW